MMRVNSNRWFFIGVCGLAVLFLTLVVLVGFYWWNAQKRLSDVNYDNSGIAVVQLRMHYNLLLTELQIAEDQGTKSSIEEAILQYDIVYQRIRSLPNRPPYDQILNAELRELIDLIFDGIRAEEENIDKASVSGQAALTGMRERLMEYRPEVELLAGRTTQLAGLFREARREEILEIAKLLIIITMGLIASGGAFALLLWRSALNAAEQNRNLMELTSELQDVSRAKSEFLAHMSHELRTPLNAIAGFSEMIATQALGKIDNSKYLEYAKHIQASGQHLISIINDVLDLSKIEAGELLLEPETFKVEEALSDTINLINFRGHRNRDGISVSIADDASDLYADLRSFRQIMINILSNADKYTPEDGDISVRIWRNGGGATLVAVADTGIGIHQDDIARILEPFGQARKNAEVSHDGTGLGLSLSNRLMMMHGGSLDVESEVDKGTTVTLRFPNDKNLQAAA